MTQGNPSDQQSEQQQQQPQNQGSGQGASSAFTRMKEQRDQHDRAQPREEQD
ncbi:hypothetical protein ACPWT1_08245 [Ramlibacter sp. MMS24-I3-19]|uniref:hypothetical protein n=1 Tax=Ramlibacter sp. MMS24-I3-19 TaxID=3416606 RepID=UPI003D0464F7